MRRRKTDCGGWASRHGPCGGCDACCPGQDEAARRDLASMEAEFADLMDAEPRDEERLRYLGMAIADLRDELGPDPDDPDNFVEPDYDYDGGY